MSEGETMRRAAMLVALATVTLSGCSMLAAAAGGGPEATLHDGVVAIELQDYARARVLLEPVYLQHWEQPVGRKAMLALTAAELDTRNPDRRLWAGADLAARLLNVPAIEPWMVPVAETYYLLALELGAQEERLARADSLEQVAKATVEAANRELPAAPGESWPQRIRAVRTERDDLRQRVTELEEQLAARAEELRVTKVELERIKKTIKP